MSDKGTDSNLTRRLGMLRQEGGGFVRVEQVEEVVGELLEQFKQDHSRHDQQIYQELEGLSGYIKAIKMDIAAMRPDEIQHRYLPSANDELDAIVEATEAATNAILSAAEHIEEVAGRVDDASAKHLIDDTTSIYEACTFQDITGQRIGKVVKALKVIQEKVDRIMVAFGSEADLLRKTAEGPTGQELLHGPQLGENTNRQDDIDALFLKST